MKTRYVTVSFWHDLQLFGAAQVGEPRYRFVTTVDAHGTDDPPPAERDVLNLAWDIGNVDVEHANSIVEADGIRSYRANQVRSLCVGDLLVINEHADGGTIHASTVHRIERNGFSTVAPASLVALVGVHTTREWDELRSTCCSILEMRDRERDDEATTEQLLDVIAQLEPLVAQLAPWRDSSGV
jgi:hypothetical protein